MPDLLTPQTIASAGPLVIDTLLKHFLSHKSLKARSKARGDDLLYDEAFVLMKTFLESATKYPVASLQKFGQVRTPAPPAVAIHHVTIPYRSLALSAEYLVKAFGGEEMAFKIAGGSKWWQVRAGTGVEAEWIVMKKDYKEWEKGEKEHAKESKRDSRAGSGTSTPKGKERVRDNADQAEGVRDDGWRNEMDEMRCMLYIHGGAYYWGSINTHRYTIWRYARKMRGRCFAVNYRKAPQYPFPCAIQDCLAAYLYLTRPPPEAKHRPVKPEHMIIAGDSAGGGLVLALLQILRDTEGLELPAGAVLISPWSDLTHSFPSILHNTSTDIVPPYSFIHKPSSLWPPPPPDLTNIVLSRLKSKIKEFTAHLLSDSSAQPAHPPADDADPVANIAMMGRPAALPETLRSSELGSKKKFSLFSGKTEPSLHPTTHGGDAGHQPDPTGESTRNPSRANPADAFRGLHPRGEWTANGEEDQGRGTTLAKCDYPVELTVKGEQVVIDTQIQLYATNAQLCYPLVSPVLGYLGGLCPLYVCCGDNEVLRDEIIYLAHKAANPEGYPIRDDVKAMMPHYKGIEARYGPTKVHLQVFDGTGHDLPLFSMCKSARGVFRAISTFARYVTPSASVMPTPTSAAASSGSASGGGGGDIFSMTPLAGPSRRNSGRLGGMLSPAKRSEGASPVLGPSDVGEQRASKEKEGGELDRDGVPGGESSVFVTPLQSLSDLSTALAPPLPTFISTASTATSTTSRPTGSTPSTSTAPSHDPALPSSPVPHRTLPSESPASMSPLSRPENSRTTSQVSTLASTPIDEKPELFVRTTLSAAAGGSGDAEPSGAGTSGDDAGPRWGGFEDDVNNAAKEGEAGYPGIYRGPEAWKDNMIRERVSVLGHLRPLEPIPELGAMTMPPDEIGTIKEGPAMRYLTGQYLWDKKYKRARKEVERHRERNLREARSKDGERITRGVRGRYEEFRAKRGVDGKQSEANGVEGKEMEGVGEVGEEKAGGGHEGEEDWSWSWAWALDGDVPPPSAIVSRRDTSEARKLALMADRLDSERPNTIGGLSIWVALATFFSHAGEKEKASEALKEEKAREKRRGSDDSVEVGMDGEDVLVAEAKARGEEVESDTGKIGKVGAAGEVQAEKGKSGGQGKGKEGGGFGKLGQKLGFK